MPSTTATIPLHQRPTSHPLSSYLLRLMLLKSSNLCLSADVSSASALLDLAATVGPSIVILKTHFDILPDWDSHPRTGTGAKLAALARRHGFLLFEDRKFSDIGSTVQKQYVEGPGRIVEWAHITNAHVLPGAAIVTSLGSAAAQWRERRRQVPVRTNISADAPQLEGGGADEKRRENDENDDERTRYAGIEEAPLERGLLLLAQMSSAENFFTPDYTKACVKIARANQDFVMGFISQESLNTTSEDHFLSMTPGCQLPAEGETAVSGDGLGQQYNTPQKIVKQMGNDIIIVGRGIIKAADPLKEAERYREKGWEAYLTRIKS